MRRFLSLFALLATLFVVGIFFFTHPTQAVVRTWDGGGTDGTCGGNAGDGNKWSCAANWSGDTVPTTSDVATFDGTSTKSVTISSNISVSGIDINAGYTGVITQASGVTVTVGAGAFDISAGTFTGSDATIDINGGFTVSGGTFTSTTGQLQVSGVFTVSSGTFNESTGTVLADGGNATWNIVTTETFNNLIISKNTASAVNISSGDTLVVTGTLTLTDGVVNTGTIDARSTISQASTFDGGTGIIDFGDNAVAQTYTANGGIAPTIRFDSASDASDSLVISAAATVTLLNVTSGFSGTIPITNTNNSALTFTTWTQDAGSYDASSQSDWTFFDFNLSAGTFVAPTTVTKTGTNATWDVNTTQTFNNFVLNSTAARTLTINTGDSFIVTGNLTLTEGSINAGSIDVRGNISEAATFDGGSTVVDFGDNAVAQTYTINGGSALTPRFDNASDANDSVVITAAASLDGLTTTSGFSGTIPLSNSGNNILTFGTWTQAAGTYDASAQSSWIVNFFTITGGTLTPPTTVTTSTANGTWNVNTTQTFNNVVVNEPNNILTIGTGDTLVVTGTLTLTDGTVNAGTIDARGNISEAGTFDGGSATIDFGDNSVAQTWSVGSGGLLPVVRFDDASDANDTVSIVAATTITGVTITSGFSGTVPLNFTGDYAVTVTTWTQAGGTFNASTQSAWIMNTLAITGGTFTPPTTVTTDTFNSGWDVNGTQTFTNVIVNKPTNVLSLSANDTLVITGTLTLTDGSINGSTGSLVSAQGNVSIGAAWDGGTGKLEFSGSGTQSFTITGGAGLFNGDIDINKTAGQVNLTTALVMDAASQDLNIVEGKLSLAGNNLTVNGTSGTFVVQDGGNFQLRGSETLTLNASNPTLSTGSTVTYTGDGDTASDTYTITTLASTYHHLVINSTDGATDTFQLGAALDVNGDLTITAGTLDVVSGQNRAITLAGNWSNSGTFNAQAGTVTLDANTAHTVSGATTWNNLTLLESSDNATNTTVTFGTGTQTIGGTLTLDGLDASDKLLIVSSSGGAARTINFTGSSTFSGDFLTITDNTVTDNSSGISLPLNPANSTNGGNTSGWFPNIGVTVSTISGNTTEAAGTATFTVVLDAQPNANVVVDSTSNDTTEGTVTTGSSLTFTTVNWATPQTVTVTGVNDDLDDGDVAYTIDVSTNDTSTLDDAYDAYDPADVSVTNTDNDTAGVTVSTISGNTTEAGGTATFTVVLNAQPTANVVVASVSSDSTEGTVSSGSSLTFTTANWATPQTVTVTGVNDSLDDGDIAYSIQTSTTDATTLDNAYDAIDPADVSVTNTDNDTAGVTVSTISRHTTEGGQTATFTVVLDAQPTANVVVESVSSDSSEGVVTGGSSLTFTTANWATPQTVTVTGQDDALTDGDIVYSITTSTNDTTTLDDVYDAIDPNDVSVTNDDNDVIGVTVSTISGNTSEAGGTATFTVVLNTQPTGNVQVDSVSSDSTEGTVTSGGTLTFTTVNWATPQTVTVTGVDDSLDDGDVSYSIQTSTNDAATADNTYDAVDPSDVSVTNTDDDTLGVTVSTISGNTTEAGGTATFTVVLQAQPTNNVVVESASGDSTEGTVTSGASLTFTSANWATPQTVTVTGVDDVVDDGDVGYSILTSTNDTTTLDNSYDAVDPANVSVTNTDNDSSNATLTESGGDTSVDEEGETTDTFTLVLTAQPSATVSVALANDADITLSTSGLTFTTLNWDTPQTVTITAVDDGLDETSPHAAFVSFAFTSGDAAYNNLPFSNLNLDVLDNDSSNVTVSPISGNTTEAGATASFTIVLGAQPSADVSFAISSTDTTEGVLTTASSVTFTSGNWNTPQTVTVQGQDDLIDDGNVAYSVAVGTASSADLAYNGIDPADVTVFNVDNDTAGITLTESSGTTVVDELGPASDTYTLVLTSQPTSDVVIDFTIDAAQIGLSPSSLTFTSVNWATPQTITITPVDDSDDEASPHLTEITHSVSSSDNVYDGFALSGLTVSILDDDTTTTTSSGSSNVQTFVTNASVEIMGVSTACETSDQVTLRLSARGAVRVSVANDPDFLTEQTFDFVVDPSLSTEGTDVMDIPWTLAGNSGDQTVYVIFTSSTNNRLPFIAAAVSLGACQPTTPDEEPPTETPDEPVPTITEGVSPYDGVTVEQVTELTEGEVFRGDHYETIYKLENGTRRPYLSDEIYYTWYDSKDTVTVVTDVTLTVYPIGQPILPNSDHVLVKIDSSPEVYVVESQNILHHIVNEAEATRLLGSAWNLFVIDLPSTIFRQYIVGAPLSSFFPWDIRPFFTRFGLHPNDDDRDGLTNDVEAELGTDPKSNDTDNDRIPDYAEVRDGTDPLAAD